MASIITNILYLVSMCHVVPWAYSSVLTIRVRMASSPIVDSGLKIDPNSVKIDFEIHDYPYANQTDSTRLALTTVVKSKTKAKFQGQRILLERQLVFNNDPSTFFIRSHGSWYFPGFPVGVFSWAPTAQMSHFSNVEVAARCPYSETGTEFAVYYTLVTPEHNLHPSSLIWDPTVGLKYEQGEPFCLKDLCGAPAVGLIAGLLGGIVLVAIGTLLLYSYKKRAHYQSL